MNADVWYLDTSAFLKLARWEPESAALLRWLDGREVCSSDLLRTEARRAVANEPGEAAALVEALLDSVTMIRLRPEVFDHAGRLAGGRRLRSLDAIHLAAALELDDDLAGVVTYDHRMAAAARTLHLEPFAPA